MAEPVLAGLTADATPDADPSSPTASSAARYPAPPGTAGRSARWPSKSSDRAAVG